MGSADRNGPLVRSHVGRNTGASRAGPRPACERMAAVDEEAEDRPQHWLELTLPPTLKKIVRCDQSGKRDADGGFWKVV
jgi:hypothetical protein